MMILHRRQLLAVSLFGLAAGAARAAETLKDIQDMQPGQFTWHPERTPDGPLAVIVSLPEQRVHVYRNGIRIAVSTCSTGKPGHETPTGVFVILEKDKNHKSSTYDEAPMPNMNRLTWSGIALHAGHLPGYPASHGCVRLPLAFSADLFSITHLGTPVIIAGGPDAAPDLVHPGMVLGGSAAGQFAQIVSSKDGSKAPLDWTSDKAQPVISVIGSSADKQMLLIENDKVVDQAPLTVTGDGKLGNYVMTMQPTGPGGALQWVDISRSAGSGATFGGGVQSLLKRLTVTKGFADAVQSRMRAGMVLVLTDAPLHPDSRTGKDFVVMAGES
jgi:hypothetical protein